MSLPKGERPDFITLYFDEPDLQGHKYGPADESKVIIILPLYSIIKEFGGKKNISEIINVYIVF